MIAFRMLAALGLAGLALAGPASAQTTVTRSETVAPGKSVRILASTNLKQDCSVGSATEVKVTTAPKNGALTTKAGKAKTPSSYRCPDKEAQVQVVLYKAKDGFTGDDAVTLTVKTPDGKVQIQDIRITVQAKADEKKADDKKADDKKDAGSL